MTLVVAGAGGVVGRHLLSAARSQGRRLRILSRVPRSREATAWDPSAAAGGDRAKLNVIRDALEGADLLVNLAGASLADGKLDENHRRVVLQSRVDSTRALLAAMREAERPPAVWLQASAVGYYGDTGERRVTEKTPRGDLFLSEVCAQWEAAAQEVGRETRLCVLRMGLVLAPDAPAWKKMLLPIKLGLGGPLGAGKQWYAWVSIEDLIRAIFFLADRPSCEGVYNVTAPSPLRQIKLAQAIAKALHRPASMPAPAFALRLAVGGVADELLLPSCRAVPARLLQEGFSFRYPSLDDFLPDLISGIRSGGSGAT